MKDEFSLEARIYDKRVLEKAGFEREGLLRKALLMWGKWAGMYIYNIIREEWKEPKILTRTT